MKMTDKLTLNELKILSALMYNELYGLEIMNKINSESGGNLMLGSLYNLLSRLEKKGFVTSRWGDDTNERGGNRRRYYKITGSAAKVVRKQQKVLTSLWGEGELSYA